MGELAKRLVDFADEQSKLELRQAAELETEKKKIKMWREAELSLAKDKAKLQAESPDSAIVWTGTLADLGDCMNGLVKKRWIKATEQNDALALACPHFVQRDGEPITPKSVIEMLRKRDKRKSAKA